MKAIITPAEHDELSVLRKEHIDATLRGAEIMRAFGADSKEFEEADRKTGELVRRIKELTGDRNHWMS